MSVNTGQPVNLDYAVTPARAWAYILPGFLLFSMLDTGAKYLVLAGFVPLFVAWCRFAGHAVFILLFMRVWQNPAVFKTAHPIRQSIRGATLAVGTITNFLALQYLQLAETLAIFLAGPVVITALSGPMLGEWAGWRRWIAVLVGFAGVLVIVRPGTSMFQWPILYSLASLTAASLYFISTRKMTATETDESMIVYSGIVPAILLAPAAIKYGAIPSSVLDLAILCSLGVFGAVGHLFIIKAHRLAPAPLIAPAVFTSIIWGTAFGYIFFGQLPDRWTVAGIIVIVASGLYILNRERVLSQADR